MAKVLAYANEGGDISLLDFLSNLVHFVTGRACFGALQTTSRAKVVAPLKGKKMPAAPAGGARATGVVGASLQGVGGGGGGAVMATFAEGAPADSTDFQTFLKMPVAKATDP